MNAACKRKTWEVMTHHTPRDYPCPHQSGSRRTPCRHPREQWACSSGTPHSTLTGASLQKKTACLGSLVESRTRFRRGLVRVFTRGCCLPLPVRRVPERGKQDRGTRKSPRETGLFRVKGCLAAGLGNHVQARQPIGESRLS